MDLILDLGNSFTKVALFQNDVLNDIKMFSTNQNHSLIKYIKQKRYDYAVLSSVRNQNTEIEKVISQVADKSLKITSKTKLPIKNNYKTPQTLGKDRIALSVGANFLYSGKDILIIDMGTSITYDFIDKDAVYQGGAISEGLNMRFKALNHFTDKLPLVQPTPQQSQLNLVGNNTQESIFIGVKRGILYEIEGFIKDYKKIYPNLQILITGGDSAFIYQTIETEVIFEPNLLVLGLNQIKNQFKKQ